MRDDQGDRQEPVRAMHRTVKRFGWRCLAMSVLDTTTAAAGRDLDVNLRPDAYPNWTYAQGFNRRTWSARASVPGAVPPKAREDGRHLLTVRYIARNRAEAESSATPRRCLEQLPRRDRRRALLAFIARSQLPPHIFDGLERAEESLVAFVEAQFVSEGRRRPRGTRPATAAGASALRRSLAVRGSSMGAGTSSASSRTPSSPACSGGGTVRWRREDEPAAAKLGFGAGAADRDLWPAIAASARRADPPGIRSRPRDVGDRVVLEVLRQSVVLELVPLRRVDDHPIGHRHELFCSRLAERRLTAPAQEHRQVEIASGSTIDAARDARHLRARARSSSPTMACSPIYRERAYRQLGVDSTSRPGHGTRITVRRCCSPIPFQSPLGRVEPLRRTGATWVNTLVRWVG